ncbi:helix-turn-helix domain-containing protein [Oribacterium sp. P6A1]|uniref:helix-turn-helix domain-containing protein n=1 Tax=Oribacterium sp. P6A1 TaxID=1410612 RepID=UPI000569C428|nr:helix-turn-helix transcriptional regulator [Oribacterium sp. P6A1]
MNLKTLRELKGLSRKELADITGVSFRSIQDYEQGHKDLSSAKAETILKMAKSLDCTMEDLISERDLSSLKPSELGTHVSKADVEKMDFSDAKSSGKTEGADIGSGAGSGASRVSEISEVKSSVGFVFKSTDLCPYTLMHKDDKVAELVFEPASGSLVSIQEVHAETLLPIGTNGNHELLKGWWHRRAVPVTQGNMRKLLELLGFLTPQAYLLRNLGLSLTDSYWLRPSGEELSWGEVNLFLNDFDDVVGAGLFAGLGSELELRDADFRFPSASTKGNVPKSWICVEGRRYLVKGVEKGNTQQAFNEAVGAYIHRRQNKFEFVDYEFYNIDYGHGRQLGVSAEAFTSENLEFVSAEELIRANKRFHRGASDYDLFVDACAEGGIDRDMVQSFLDYQILSDFVITNTDRSYENFGVLRDADTLEFVKMAPIFDSGNSMFYDLNMSHGTLELNNIPVDSFAENEAGLIKLVKDPSILDLDKLLTNDELSQVLASSNRTPEEIRVLVKIYERKKDMLFKLKRGDVNWLRGV